MAEYRRTQVERLDNNPDLTIGDVTTVNLTILKGGVQANVVPPSMKLIYDVRIAIDVQHNEFENMVELIQSLLK